MTTAGLQKKIAEVLGVSSSEKELAFEIFILKTCEILTENVTLKVQRIGFFQMKENSEINTCNLLFIPLSEDLYRDSKNLFLTIPIPSHHNKEHDLDQDVFSIGVGKPVLPLSGNGHNDTETSYAILRKSIEERVNEILAASDQLPNFNIWDDYYKSVKYVEHPAKEKINDFTADSEFKEEFMAEELTKNLLELSSDTDDGIVNTTEVTPSEVSLDDLLGDLKLEEPSEMELPEMEPDEKFEELSSFSKELEPDETQIPEAIPLEAELTGENDLENALQKIIDETENNIEKDSEKFAEPGTEVLEVISKSEDLNEIKIDEDIEEPKNADVDFNDYIQDENTIEKIDNAENREFAEIDKIISDLKSEPGDQLSEPENDFVEFDNETFEPEEQPVDSLEVEVPTKLKETLYELKHESKLDEVDLDKTDEENIEPGYYLGLKRKNEESLEWDWGDELKEEFGVEFLKEEELKASKDFEEERHLKDESETIDDFFKIAGHTKPTLFDELESTVKKEIEETRDFEETKNFDETVEPHQVLEYAGEPRRYHFIDEQQPETGITEIRKGSEAGYNFEPMDEVMAEYNENEKGFSFGKTFLIVFSSFVVVVAIIVYMLMNNTEQPKEQADSNAVKDSFSLNEPSNKIDSSQLVVDEYSDFPRVAKLPSKGETSDVKPGNDIGTTSNEPVVQPVTTGPETKNRDLYRTISTETRVSNNIYFDGRQYNFQVSSWKNRYKAEQEVERLRGKGYSAFAVEVYLPQKGGTWFRVRVGNFKSKEEAEQFLSKNTF